MIYLEQYYPGEEDWILFSDLYRNIPDSAIANKLESIFKDRSVAIVIAGILGNSSLEWINKKIPALDNLRPVDCVDDPKLQKRLRTMLMRMDL
ncbi:hypothetical protein ACFS6H_17255 [Terrimonas rubra]|uniref:Antitoxin Xre/MbcA/ParS-like toxin-binding domain-containing protein n=1 Tax=Terrimonas rubra TaxID=1035890 RepID=A0ABW6A7Y1_9BACT